MTQHAEKVVLSPPTAVAFIDVKDPNVGLSVASEGDFKFPLLSVATIWLGVRLGKVMPYTVCVVTAAVLFDGAV